MKKTLQVVTVCLALLCLSVTAFAADYYVIVNNSQQGPVPMEQLQQMAKDGAVSKGSMVWKDGMADWVKAGDQQDLQGLFATTPPPLPPAIPTNTPPPAPPVASQKQDATDPGTINAMGQDKPEPPQPPVLQPGDDLESVISAYAIELQIFFDNQGAPYTVSKGVAPMNMSDKAVMGYINSMNLAYKDALLRAYVDMAAPINPNGQDISTEEGVKSRMSEGDSILDDLKETCREEANREYQKYLAEKERQRRDKEKEENSFIGLIKNKLKGDADSENVTPQPAVEKPEPDFIYTCSGDGNVYVQSSAMKNSISDTLAGGRVWASMLHEGMIGVVLVKSNSTSEMASILENQMEPSAPLQGAFAEVADKVKDEISKFPVMPLGLVGTRMMKLSNGEWALYSFGAAQVSSGKTQSFMDRAKMASASGSGNNAALAELSRFSGLVVNLDVLEKAISSTREKLTFEINVTQGTEKLKVDPSSTLGKVFEASFSGSSNLNLVGAQTVYSKKFTDGPLSFHLSAQAWSPSIMASNMAKRKGYDSAADNAVRSGRYQTPESKTSSGSKKSGSESQVIIMNQDW